MTTDHLVFEHTVKHIPAGQFCAAWLSGKTTITEIGSYYQISSVFYSIDKKKHAGGNNFSLLVFKILKSFPVIILSNAHNILSDCVFSV